MAHLAQKVRDKLKLAKHMISLERHSNRGWPNFGLLRRGLLSNRAWLYPLSHYHHELFLTDIEIEARLPRLNSVSAQHALSDKRRFHELVVSGLLPAVCPKLVGILWDDTLFSPDGAIIDPAELEGTSMIAKPINGSGGRGVAAITSISALSFTEPYIIEKRVIPHPYAAAIFLDAINTVRVLTGFDRDSDTVIVLGAAHRFGTKQSAPTDNFKAGGLVALVDPDTGILSDAVIDTGKAPRQTLPHHPETGTLIEGVVVPQWDDVKVVAQACMRAIPGLVYVGWDFALSPSGPVLIEGNAGLANPNLIQMHRPILLDETARAFLAAHGIVSEQRLRRIERQARLIDR
ncbi:sugar-transfer associated ATP-grasp domain-containing protein [Nitratireductor sp. GCM10026969]|uniref:sugar-transfer associated ATP-grasp domain-containing protein n=1 Tax=Nitratireductor sp. GCM10026969 TaxID=3252645 RepID=UPI003607928E